mmetsp:Transcript_11716/g.21220  ORF Transcript_11716/g.21220 Transcript_11716/m.21220 type:complete len:227 (-) Transcript_11716:285-965(-)
MHLRHLQPGDLHLNPNRLAVRLRNTVPAQWVVLMHRDPDPVLLTLHAFHHSIAVAHPRCHHHLHPHCVTNPVHIHCRPEPDPVGPLCLALLLLVHPLLLPWHPQHNTHPDNTKCHQTHQLLLPHHLNHRDLHRYPHTLRDLFKVHALALVHTHPLHLYCHAIHPQPVHNPPRVRIADHLRHRDHLPLLDTQSILVPELHVDRDRALRLPDHHRVPAPHCNPHGIPI